MSQTYISVALRQLVQNRANNCCEYCLVNSEDVLLPHQVDHIIAEQHGGETVPENLAFACIHCNRHKGPNIASLDFDTGQLVSLFHPRQNNWTDHFKLEGAYIRALTAIGRVTIHLLKLNHSNRVLSRQTLIEAGRYGVSK